MSAGSHDDFADLPPTDLDDVENQNEEDEVFGWTETPPVDDVADPGTP